MAEAIKNKEFAFIEGLTTELSSKHLIFPTSLNATMKIRHVLNDPDASIEKIIRAVSMELVLSAQLLGLCNCVTFNPAGKPITSLRVAIPRLGLSMVRNVAIAVGMQQMMQQSSHKTPPIVEGLWKRSVRVAALSLVAAKKCTRLNPDTAMLAGLLHDIGKFYILNRAHDYTDVFVDAAAIWSIVDQWHADIGEAILESWEIPDEICMAVKDHRDLNRVHTGAPDLTDLVTAADFLDRHFYPGIVEQIDWNKLPPALGYLHLDEECSRVLIEDAKHELAMIFNAIH